MRAARCAYDYFAATRRAISHIIVTPRRTFSTDIRSLFP